MRFDSSNLIHKEITDQILRAAIDVHRELGPGLLESTYECCLYDELVHRGLTVGQQLELPVIFKGRKVDCGYRIDLLVENKVIIEVKSVEKISPIHSVQLLTYMRLAGIEVGFVINFNVTLLKDGLVRRVLTIAQPNSSSALSAISAVTS